MPDLLFLPEPFLQALVLASAPPPFDVLVVRLDFPILKERVNGYPLGAICAVTLSRFTGEKGADISPQNKFWNDSPTPHLTIFNAEYRKKPSEPVFLLVPKLLLGNEI